MWKRSKIQKQETNVDGKTKSFSSCKSIIIIVSRVLKFRTLEQRI